MIYKNDFISNNLDNILIKSLRQSMNSNEKPSEQELTSKEKRSIYMSQLRGSINSEYRQIERENNARAMRKKRLENSVYRENERLQNRTHMAEIRRQNIEYRQREHIKNRHRMALKRNLISQTLSNKNSSTSINPIYQTLENNLQSSHISFIPYQTNVDFSKQKDQSDILQQIEEYCRQQNTSSSLDSISSTSSS